MTNRLNIWFEAISGSLKTLLSEFAAFIPSLLAAIVILIIGYIVSRVLRSAIRVVLRKIGVDKLASATGVSEHLDKFGKNATISNVISVLIFWIIFLIFIVSAADSLGLSQLGETIDIFIIFIPKIIAATFILLLGLAAASFVKTAVYESAKAAGFDFAKPLSTAVFSLIVILTLSLSISQLEINTLLLDMIIGILLATLGIAAAISLGLGSKAASKSIVYSIYVAEAVKVSDLVTLKDGTKGTVLDIGAIVTTIRLENESLKLIENEEFLNGLTIH